MTGLPSNTCLNNVNKMKIVCEHMITIICYDYSVSSLIVRYSIILFFTFLWFIMAVALGYYSHRGLKIHVGLLLPILWSRKSNRFTNERMEALGFSPFIRLCIIDLTLFCNIFHAFGFGTKNDSEEDPVLDECWEMQSLLLSRVMSKYNFAISRVSK